MFALSKRLSDISKSTTVVRFSLNSAISSLFFWIFCTFSFSFISATTASLASFTAFTADSFSCVTALTAVSFAVFTSLIALSFAVPIFVIASELFCSIAPFKSSTALFAFWTSFLSVSTAVRSVAICSAVVSIAVFNCSIACLLSFALFAAVSACSADCFASFADLLDAKALLYALSAALTAISFTFTASVAALLAVFSDPLLASALFLLACADTLAASADCFASLDAAILSSFAVADFVALSCADVADLFTSDMAFRKSSPSSCFSNCSGRGRDFTDIEILYSVCPDSESVK